MDICCELMPTVKLAHVSQLEDFGTRSLAIHGIMAVVFANAVLVGLFVGGELGLASFLALLGFSSGLWVAHSIHSLGNVDAEEYSGIINELFDTDDGSDDGFDTGRFGRLLGLIAAVTAVALLTSAQALSGTVLSVTVIAIGVVALVTAIVGFLIALGASYDEAEKRRLAAIDRNADPIDVDAQRANER